METLWVQMDHKHLALERTLVVNQLGSVGPLQQVTLPFQLIHLILEEDLEGCWAPWLGQEVLPPLPHLLRGYLLALTLVYWKG